MKRINTIACLAVLLLSTSTIFAGPKTKSATPRKPNTPVTVTLVRWPYT